MTRWWIDFYMRWLPRLFPALRSELEALRAHNTRQVVEDRYLRGATPKLAQDGAPTR